MSVIGTMYIALAFVIVILGSYTVGYHQGEVDKHKEIFDLLNESMKEVDSRYWTIQGQLIETVGDFREFLGLLKPKDVRE